jgi:hypothetical protein
MQPLRSPLRPRRTPRHPPKILPRMQRRRSHHHPPKNRNQRRLALRPTLRIPSRRTSATERAPAGPSPVLVRAIADIRASSRRPGNSLGREACRPPPSSTSYIGDKSQFDYTRSFEMPQIAKTFKSSSPQTRDYGRKWGKFRQGYYYY